jgi:putative OPT family oligopeptide transporter
MQKNPRMKQDSFALVFGLVVSTILAGTLVIAGLKAGITPGVSPLVILFAWGAFTRRIAAGGGSSFLNIAQVAGSAGMAVTAGVIFTAPLIQILYANLDLPVPPVDVLSLIVMSLAGSLIGFGYVGLTRKKFLTDPTLPAPEARACETMIEAAVAEPEKRPKLGRSLYAGLVASFVAPLVVRVGAATEHVVLAATTIEANGEKREFQLDLPFTPIYIGIGGLLTMSTALLVFGGSFLRSFGDFLLASMDPVNAVLIERFPANSMRWVGGGAMTVAVAYSLTRFFQRRQGAADARGQNDGGDLLAIDPVYRNMLIGSIVLGAMVLAQWSFLQDGFSTFSFAMTAAVLICCAFMVALGAILSLQIGSSASPVSGTVFVTTLVLCLVALAIGRNEIDDVLLLTPLVVGACVAVCAANDSSQDYKTMQLCGLRVQRGFVAQLLGLICGSIVVPIVLYVAHNAYTLGSGDLPAPQATMFATLVQGLLLQSKLPWWPIGIGVAIGIVTVVADVVGARRGLQLPSMAFAVGIYLPPFLGIGILLGSLCRWFGERGHGRQRNESILTAAGLITGAAALDLILGVMILAGFDVDQLRILKWPTIALNVTALAGIACLGGLLFFNSKR